MAGGEAGSGAVVQWCSGGKFPVDAVWREERVSECVRGCSRCRCCIALDVRLAGRVVRFPSVPRPPSFDERRGTARCAVDWLRCGTNHQPALHVLSTYNHYDNINKHEQLSKQSVRRKK